jgi:hypothetical protein
MLRTFIILCLVVLVSAACTARTTPATPVEPTATIQPSPTPAQPYIGPEDIETLQPAEPYPGIEPYPEVLEPEPYLGVGEPFAGTYPGPGETGEQPFTYIPPEPNEFSPQPGDETLSHSEIFFENGGVQLVVMESFPVQAALNLRGSLPDGCHTLRVKVPPPDGLNNIYIEVYSLRNDEMICTAVLEPFEVSIPLGSFAGGQFQVFFNGTEIGSISG